MHKVLLVDDHKLVLDGLTALLEGDSELEMVKACTSAEEALTYLKAWPVDLVMTDIDMPGMTGIELTKTIRDKSLPLKVLVLTMHNERSIIRQIMDIGADGYMLKTSSREEMLLAVRQVLAGKKYFSAEVTETLLTDPPAAVEAMEIDLTEREIEILKLIAEGYTNKEIGESLFISHRTVDAHRTNMMKKLEVNNVAGLVRFAMKNGLIS